MKRLISVCLSIFLAMALLSIAPTYAGAVSVDHGYDSVEFTPSDIREDGTVVGEGAIDLTCEVFSSMTITIPLVAIDERMQYIYGSEGNIAPGYAFNIYVTNFIGENTILVMNEHGDEAYAVIDNGGNEYVSADNNKLGSFITTMFNEPDEVVVLGYTVTLLNRDENLRPGKYSGPICYQIVFEELENYFID